MNTHQPPNVARMPSSVPADDILADGDAPCIGHVKRHSRRMFHGDGVLGSTLKNLVVK